MKLITKKNFISVLCCTYTIISLFICIFESIIYKRISHDHLNILACFVLSFISLVILSQQYRFDNIPMIIIILIQYIIAILCIFLIVFISSFFMEISTGGYKDIFISFSSLYIIGTIIYYMYLKIEIKKENKILKQIKNNNVN